MLQKLVQDARQSEAQLHWLDLQDANRYRWERVIGQSPETNGRVAFYRRLGVVEGLFDSDATLSCGRADLHQNHIYEIRTSLSDKQLRERLVLAWALMRASHILLASQSVFIDEIVPRSRNRRWVDKCFLYHCPRSLDEAVNEARNNVKFVEDDYPDVDVRQFFIHSINTNRVLDANLSLSRLHVLPFRRISRDSVRLHLITTFAHQIADGLTMFRWTSHIGRILNMPEAKIKAVLANLLHDPERSVPPRLPPSQEALYPIRSPSLPRQRWHWLLTRILRHVRNPPPLGFQNPLRRRKPQLKAITPQTLYPKTLDYSVTPPLNAGQVTAYIHGSSFHKLRQLCRKAHISIGSGIFTLTGMVMMQLEESLHPFIPLQHRLPFIGSFPVNPRPFLSQQTTGNEDNCMLAFSDGVTLPFLPTDLDFIGRFKLLGRLAHNQLRQYQKRPRSLSEEVHLGSRSPSQLLPALYCGTLERQDSRYPEEQKAGVTVQGAYPVKPGGGLATCGVSSVGDVSTFFDPPNVDFETVKLTEERDLIADFKSVYGCVRPREGEFLIGAVGDTVKEEVKFDVAYDASVMDEGKVEEWKSVIEAVLDGIVVDDGAGDGARAKL